MGKGRKQKKTIKKKGRKYKIEDFTERRKIISSGRGARQVTLPIDWVHAMGLAREGSKVDVVCFKRDNNFLSLIPVRTERKRIVAIISGAWRPSSKVYEKECMRVNRKILAAYLIGHEVIHVKNRSGAIPKNLKKEVEHFCGKKLHFAAVRIVGVDKMEINVPGIKGFSIKERIEDMHELTKRMHKEAVRLMDNFDVMSAQVILNMDDDVDMFCHETVRFCKLCAQNPLIVKELNLRNYRDLIGFRVISRRIERCADHAVRMISDMLQLYQKGKIIKFDPEIKKALKHYSDVVINILDKAVVALFASKGNYQMADSIIEEVNDAVKELENLTRKVSESTTPEQLWSQRRILASLKRTAEYTKTIAEIICNLHISSIIEEQPS